MFHYREIASVLGCDIVLIPIMYLGLPLGAKASFKEPGGGEGGKEVGELEMSLPFERG